jgi:hypothetical protein
MRPSWRSFETWRLTTALSMSSIWVRAVAVIGPFRRMVCSTIMPTPLRSGCTSSAYQAHRVRAKAKTSENSAMISLIVWSASPPGAAIASAAPGSRSPM